jgi:hypothetical protein
VSSEEQSLGQLEGGAMKARVRNEKYGISDAVVDIRSLDYKYVSGFLPGAYEKVKVPYEDVEFIFDNEWEKNIVKYRDILRIVLPKGVSPRFYAAIADGVEGYFNGEINNICILADIEEKVRKKYWYKRIVILINNSRPVMITASGKEYQNIYNINIEEVDLKSMAAECKEGMCRLRELINASNEQLKLYERVLYHLENPAQKQYKAIEGN